MAEFKGGLQEAAKMLSQLGGAAAKRLLEEIRIKDPVMAEKLKNNMVQMEDLQHLSAPMLVGLLRDLDMDTFGLALRGIDQEIVSKLLAMVSSGIKRDIEEGLKGKPKKVSEVEEAQSKVLEVVRAKIDQGVINLTPDGDEYV